jgi:hypothetical protein
MAAKEVQDESIMSFFIAHYPRLKRQDIGTPVPLGGQIVRCLKPGRSSLLAFSRFP